MEATRERERIQAEAAETTRAQEEMVRQIRQASAEEVTRAEERREAEVKAMAEKTATDIARLQSAFAEREARAANETMEAERIHQRAARARDADLEQHNRILAETKA